jgi:hypothetical protein
MRERDSLDAARRDAKAVAGLASRAGRMTVRMMRSDATAAMRAVGITRRICAGSRPLLKVFFNDNPLIFAWKLRNSAPGMAGDWG